MRKTYLLLLIMGLFSCDSMRIYEEYREVDRFWRTDDRLTYDFEIEEVKNDYKVIAEIKNDLSYPYRNFYFNYRLLTDADSVLEESLQQIQLFEPKTGKPYGTGVGDQYNNQIVIEEKLQFPVAGTYQIDLSQFMRVDSMRGIHRVGVRIEMVQ